MIGHRWKCGNVCRLMILIGRGLDLKEQFERVCWKFHGQLPVQFSRCVSPSELQKRNRKMEKKKQRAWKRSRKTEEKRRKSEGSERKFKAEAESGRERAERELKRSRNAREGGKSEGKPQA